MSDRRQFLKQSLLAVPGFYLGSSLSIPTRPEARIEVEEDIYQYVPANNGAGPMWAKGLTSVVRYKDKVFVSGLETDTSVEGLSNCRWKLFQRYASGWKLETKDLINYTREPAPLGLLRNGTLLLYANPKMADGCKEYCLTQPEILAFPIPDLHLPYQRIIPEWNENPGLNDHSYRAFAVDGETGAMVLFQNYMYDHAEWCFRDENQTWSASGQIHWPRAMYDGKESSLRLCYSNVSLKERKVFFFSTGDIIEPDLAWREYKKKLTGQNWDYVFRRIFFTWSDDITTGKFHPWVELANRDAMAGQASHEDLWVAPDGSAHLLWLDKALDDRLQTEFFPGKLQEKSLRYTVIRNGQVVVEKKIISYREGEETDLTPGCSKFHATPDGRLFVLFYLQGKKKGELVFSENRLIEIDKDTRFSEPLKVSFKTPFTLFQLANERAGCDASYFIDVLGVQEGKKNTIGYARIRLK